MGELPGMPVDLRSVPKHLIESASRLISYLQCPALEQRGTSPAMIAGTLRHWAIEHYVESRAWPDLACGPGADQIPDLIESCASDVRRAVAHIPHADQILSVEGSCLPSRVRYEAYGKRFAMLDLGGDHWLRGAADLVEEVDPTCLGIVDWKGRERTDNEIQSLCYALMYSQIFPGFRRIRVKFVYLGSGEVEELKYEIDDLEALRGYLIGIIDRKRSDTERKPTQCIRCPTCIHFATCPEGLARAATPLMELPTTPKPGRKTVNPIDVVSEYQLPATVPERIELRRRVKVASAVAEALLDRLSDAVRADLEPGPVVIDGREWRLHDQGGQYQVVDQPAALDLLTGCGIDYMPMLRLSSSDYRQAVDAQIKGREAAGEDCRELRSRYSDTIRQSHSRQIKDRAAK